jgi:hypothetical protein
MCLGELSASTSAEKKKSCRLVSRAATELS